MLDFLSRVVSSSGFICLATPSTQHKGFDHACCDTPEKAQWLLNKWNDEGKDVYFAVGTLKEKYIEVNGKRKRRVAENIHELKALILDLDVGAKKPYKTQAEAITHLKTFIKDVGLPAPTVVSSGYGVHVYWPFTKAIPADHWRKLAVKFKGLTQAYGLHADPARTSDVASILRLPGSYNFKDIDNPREVKVLSRVMPEPTPPRTLAEIVIKACETFNVKPVVDRTAPKVDTGLGSFEIAHEPADFKQIAKRCKVIHKAISDQENTPEPVWRGVLMVVRHCGDAERLIHAVSYKHPDYTSDGTIEKVNRLTQDNVGPMICDTFDFETRGACLGCESRGRIKSPISLGYTLKETTHRPALVIDHGNGEQTTVELPPPPYPFMRTTSGAIAIRVKDEDGRELDPETIYDFDIHPTKRMYDEVEQTEVFVFRSVLPHDGWREYPIPAYLIYDERKLMETLARQGVMPDMAQKSRLVGYMLAYIQSLQRQMPADQIYNQFGWRKDDTELVIGSRCYTRQGMKQIKVNEQFKNVIPNLEVKGTLEEWKKVVNIYNHKGAEDFAFALMMGFGQLTFKFSGYEGSIFNLHGDSGAGKSTLLKLIHSIYGIPTERSLLHIDTVNAKLAMIGCYNNLPVTYDEITNIDPEDLSDLAYAMSNGRGKESLTQNRTLRLNTTTWQTTMYCTSNDPLVPMLTAHKGKASGEVFRVMERTVRVTAKHTLSEAREIFAPLEHNYGVAGEVLASWLVNNVDTARAMMVDAYKEISDKVKGESPERFWLAMCAQAIVGARLGKMLGLHDYDVDWIIEHAMRIIQESRGVVVKETKSFMDIVVEYMNSNINRMLVTNKNGNTGIVHMDLKPTQGILIRHEREIGHISIAKHEFRDWCVSRHYDATAIHNWLIDSGIMVNDHISKSLGAGTEYLTGKQLCFIIDSRHNEVAGGTKLTVVGQASDVPEEGAA